MRRPHGDDAPRRREQDGFEPPSSRPTLALLSVVPPYNNNLDLLAVSQFLLDALEGRFFEFSRGIDKVASRAKTRR